MTAKEFIEKLERLTSGKPEEFLIVSAGEDAVRVAVFHPDLHMTYDIKIEPK